MTPQRVPRGVRTMFRGTPVTRYAGCHPQEIFIPHGRKWRRLQPPPLWLFRIMAGQSEILTSDRSPLHRVWKLPGRSVRR